MQAKVVHCPTPVIPKAPTLAIMAKHIMKPRLLAILLISITQTLAFSQVTTMVRSKCVVFSDSTLKHRISTLNKRDSVKVSRYYLVTDAYFVTRDSKQGYVFYKNLKHTPALSALRQRGYLTQKQELMRVRTRNNISVNLLGDVSTFSFSYERLVFLGPSSFLAGKLGVGYRFESTFLVLGDSYLTMPFHITANFGLRKHFLEIGMGTTTDLAGAVHNYHENKTFTYVIVGYRFQPTISNLRIPDKSYFRFNLIFMGSEDAIRAIAPIGISFGKTF